ncbi:hypothetical protein FRC11_014268 [Ceratobasidium sp. 423]|nr:hypothetical protein FRC11_014268 [Ceratobasidium sp. 423]
MDAPATLPAVLASHPAITSTSRMSDRLKPVNPIIHPGRFRDVIEGIARTKKVLILSGDAALDGTGIQPLDSYVPQSHQLPRTTYWSLIRDATREPHKYPMGALAIFNRVMTERRMAARHAKRNIFLDYLDKLSKADRLTKCLTTSIDGLEAESSPDVACRVSAIYGDNRHTRCLVSGCEGCQVDTTTALDTAFLTQEMTKCPGCHPKYMVLHKESPQDRRVGSEELRALWPCVQRRCGLSFVHVELPGEDNGDEDEDYVDQPDAAPAATKGHASASQQINVPAGGKQRKGNTRGNRKAREKRQPAIKFTPPDPITVAGYDEGCHLLLILGAPPKDPDLLDATRELASSVHARGGAVVYVDPAPLHGGSQHDHIDIHLQANIQEAVGEVMQQMRRRLDPSDNMDGDLRDDGDLWFELVQNDVPVRNTPKHVFYGRDTCANCYCSVPEYLAKCTRCPFSYCYRRVQYDGSEDEDSESEEGSQVKGPPNKIGASTDAEAQHFPFHEACITFNMFSAGGSRPSLADATQSFVCPECWKHEERGIYPHYLRPPTRDSVELNGEDWPRLIMVVYYVEEFWPHAKHLITLTTGFWRQMGWEYLAQPVKLQHLKERDDPFANLQWERRTYQFIAVYLTHGLTGEQGYQLNNDEALRPAELLATSLPVAQTALNGASYSFVFLFACGHPMYNPGLVAELEQWVNTECNPGLVVACLNKKLSPTYMFNLFTKLTKGLAARPDQARNVVHMGWMRDSIATSHSDLVCLARNQPVELWLYAPFQSRPLGKALPSVLSVCECSAQDASPQGTNINKRRRKIWKVEHDGKHGDMLRDVKVKAICRACGQAWILPQETMAGKLIKVNGVYGAVVPYICSCVEIR